MKQTSVSRFFNNKRSEQHKQTSPSKRRKTDQPASIKHISKENLNVEYRILFSHTKAAEIFQQLEKKVIYYKDELARIQIFGKWRKIPRQQVAFGNEGLFYRFSGNTLPARPWTQLPILLDIKQAIEKAMDHKFTFNFVLINRYEDGEDYMGEHRDNEKELIPDAPIASVSFGQSRDFNFRHKDARGRHKNRLDLESVSILLQSGSLLIMNPPTNTFWYHSLPVRKNVKFPRINLTFRILESVK